MVAHTDVAVIGGGVVGLACAHAVAQSGKRVVAIERELGLGRGTTSRNSGVIHAGIYYPPASLKARLCLRGKALLYDWCVKHEVPHARTGKIIVATDAREASQLQTLLRTARALGATGLTIWDPAELAKHDSLLHGTAALHSDTSGIVDPHALVESLAFALRERGGEIATGTTVVAAEDHAGTSLLRTRDTLDRETEITADLVINACGLHADTVAAGLGLDVDARDWRQRLYKGSYYSLSSSAPQPKCALVYPLPDKTGLGIHLTRDLGDRVRAGPDAEHVEQIDYRVDESKAATFAARVQRYLPDVQPEHLQPEQAGIRPTLPGAANDFVIEPHQRPNGARAIHLLGIDSPGLTAALAIGEHVLQML